MGAWSIPRGDAGRDRAITASWLLCPLLGATAVQGCRMCPTGRGSAGAGGNPRQHLVQGGCGSPEVCKAARCGSSPAPPWSA